MNADRNTVRSPIQAVAAASLIAVFFFGDAPSAMASSGTSAWCDAPASGLIRQYGQVDIGDPWFVVLRIEPGVFAITEPRQAEGVNSYLIVGTARAVLFDSGLGIGRISRAVRRLTALPVTVINSHTHFDHVGGNAEFDDVRNLDDRFSARSAKGLVSPQLAAYADATLDHDHICGTLPAGAPATPYRIRTWHVSAFVHDGEVFELGQRKLEVIVSPGHTPDSLTLIDRRNGLLFTGDTYYSGEIYLWADETNLESFGRSIDRLAELVPRLKRLLPGHGAPSAEPRRLVELQRAVRLVRSSQGAFTPTKDEHLLYRFGAFSLLLDAAASYRPTSSH